MCLCLGRRASLGPLALAALKVKAFLGHKGQEVSKEILGLLAPKVTKATLALPARLGHKVSVA
jgi:hypothetical protein